MKTADRVAARLRRFEAELRRHRPVTAYQALWTLWLDLPLGEQEAHGPALLEPASRVGAEYFGDAAQETLQAAEAWAGVTGAPEALGRQGLALSLRARGAWDRGMTEEARSLAAKSEQVLVQATEQGGFDPDLWGTLGGLRSRMADWARAENPTGAERLEESALEAYGRGWQIGPDAYPALNFLELRAIRACRNDEGREDYLAWSALCTDKEQASLRAALDVRRRQVVRQEDAPWASFDVARGQHYLQPNVARFLSELADAVEEAHRVARTSRDRWMVETAARSLRRLQAGRVPVEGLEAGLRLLEEAARSSRWEAGHWESVRGTAGYLRDEFRDVRTELERLRQGASAQDQQRLSELLSRAAADWKEEEEAAFQAELKQIQLKLEPPQKRLLRVAKRMAGNLSLADIAGALGASTGATTALKVAQELVKAAKSEAP